MVSIRRGAAFFLFLALAVFFPLFCLKTWELLTPPLIPSFDYGYVEALRKTNPDYVMVGNSMLESRINRTLFGELLGNKKVELIWGRGWESAHWYLTLKNIVAASEIKPRAVFFLFFEDRLAFPKFNTEGTYDWDLKCLMIGEEPILWGILGREPVHFVSQMRNWLRAWTVHFGIKSWIREKMSQRALKLAGSGTETLNDIYGLFSYGNIFRDFVVDPPGPPPSVESPETRLQQSLVPEMLKLSKKHGIPLVFVRIKTRFEQKLSPERTYWLTAYMKTLKQMLSQGGALLYDMSEDPKITSTMYGEGDHIAAVHRDFFTRNFYHKIQRGIE